MYADLPPCLDPEKPTLEPDMAALLIGQYGVLWRDDPHATHRQGVGTPPQAINRMLFSFPLQQKR